MICIVKLHILYQVQVLPLLT